MVDTATSKAAAARREGSNPSWGTMSSGLCNIFFNRVLETVRTVLVGWMKECGAGFRRRDLTGTDTRARIMVQVERDC